MFNENPLDLIRSMNEQKNTEEEKSKKLESENLVKNQEAIDQEYDSLKEQKKVLVEDVEKFKQRLEEIKGTREEMISQYHEAINEAKKNPETLEYVREHFSDIFKEGKEKWQEIRNELSLTQESEKNKSEDIQNIDSQIEEISPKTTEGKLKIKRDQEIEDHQKAMEDYQKERYQQEIKDKEKTIERLEENIEHGKFQKRDYSDILDQEVEYTREQYLSGEAKIISDDATEFTKLWKEVHNKDYSDKDIKIKIKKLEEVKDKIDFSLQKVKSRASSIGYARKNNGNYPSFPFISVGHGNHYLDDSLLGRRMTLGELLDKDIEIKTKQLEEAKTELQKIKEKE